MARKARVEFAGAVYHVLDRGDRREAIFRDDQDRLGFLRTLGEACEKTGWNVHAYVLMNNHYHLMVETPEGNLTVGMHWFQATWTARFNRRHGLSGHLFQGRYKAVVVERDAGNYFAVLSDYIHLNPVRAHMVSLEERLFDYCWSSYPHYVRAANRPAWLKTDAVLSALGLRDDSAGRRFYAERMRSRAVEELTEGGESALRTELRHGWCLGSAGFRERMLVLLDAAREKLPGVRKVDGSVRRSHDEEEARRILYVALTEVGLAEGELASLRKGDRRKLAVAALVRKRTAVPNAWIAEKLYLGHVSQVSRCVERMRGEPVFLELEEAVPERADAKFTT